MDPGAGFGSVALLVTRLASALSEPGVDSSVGGSGAACDDVAATEPFRFVFTISGFGSTVMLEAGVGSESTCMVSIGAVRNGFDEEGAGLKSVSVGFGDGGSGSLPLSRSLAAGVSGGWTVGCAALELIAA